MSFWGNIFQLFKQQVLQHLKSSVDIYFVSYITDFLYLYEFKSEKLKKKHISDTIFLIKDDVYSE